MSKPELELIGADGKAFMILGFKVRHKRTFFRAPIGIFIATEI